MSSDEPAGRVSRRFSRVIPQTSLQNFSLRLTDPGAWMIRRPIFNAVGLPLVGVGGGAAGISSPKNS
jgi:hypothetical protein